MKTKLTPELTDEVEITSGYYKGKKGVIVYVTSPKKEYCNVELRDFWVEGIIINIPTKYLRKIR